MRRSTGVVGLIGVIMLIGVAGALTAAASSAVAVSMTFAEPAHPDPIKGCAVFPDGFCGSGQVIPFGRATETISFGAGCGGACDLRVITLPQGVLTLQEWADGGCLGTCHTWPVESGIASLTDTVIGGTGLFAGATGELTGTVRAAVSNVRPAGGSEVQLSGWINLDR